ncbi:SDR family NAD(P)-dependent oxidoreductase [Hydrogenophaga sp.]|uniref:SDR family NAD(P)-dependent oxidoreductase n=1 Tax=Hydrogenophaga sp. TaxID=1904254 RepID=UPI00271609F2|nr:SDR family oxidoreductase [Hydrogenophaga sp.]MDO9436261.1 SDR family oxidoreductase [Hydrogenophaga sp.]
MQPRFDSKTAVVVSISNRGGGAFGIAGGARNLHVGAVCARAFAQEGAHVWLVDEDADALRTLADEIRAAGGRADVLIADPCDAQALLDLVARSGDTVGPVHALVNGHFESTMGRVEGSTAAEWLRAVQVNLLGPVHATQAFLPLLKRAASADGGAAIVHIGSIDGTLGNPQIPAYSAAKGGIVPLTHVMADEFGAYGIRVNCVARAMMVERGAPPHPRFAPLVAQTPLGRPAYPDEVAAAACFLASAEAAYINGVVLPVDGGRSGITPGTRRQPPEPT